MEITSGLRGVQDISIRPERESYSGARSPSGGRLAIAMMSWGGR